MVDHKPECLHGTAIILAAGASVRFGSDKRVIPFANTTLLQHTVDLYASVFRRVLLVLRKVNCVNLDTLPKHVKTVLAHNAHDGLSQSLKAGLKQALKEPWTVVGLMDMPYVQVQTLTKLAGQLRTSNASIIRPRYKQQYGNPVGFKQECYSRLFELAGDQGARMLFDTGEFSIETLDVDDRGILIDIDTPEQLQESANLAH